MNCTSLHLRVVIIVLMLSLITFSCKKSARENIRVENLRCEMLVKPLGIDVPNPHLSWESVSDQRNIVQKAYQIVVASSLDKLGANDGDLWSSGRIESDRSNQVLYEGKKLNGLSNCYWKVRVWSANGESEWSAPASWSMGLLHYKDWKGRWIGFDRAFPWDRIEQHSRLSARYFRKEFETQSEKTITRATAFIIGLGLYELYINGERIGDQVLAPSPTDYLKNVKYNTFDVTRNIRQGRNAIGTALGNGRYFIMWQNYKPYKYKNFGYPKMLLNLVIEYNDGTDEVISTDDSWKGTADGPIRSNNEYDGEEYDARKEMPGWNNIGFDDSEWLSADYVQEPGGDYEAQMNENMRVMRTIQPKAINKLSGNRYILDMGQNMTGWLKMKVTGKRGDRVVLKFAESLQENGELYVANLRDARVTDVYILKGKGQETWEPRFVYHGFRYAEVSGFPGIPALSDFEGCVVYDGMPTVGHFKTSDSLINQIYANATWSIMGNYKGMPVDCPQRDERMPWLGDRATGCSGESFVLDNSKLYIKWLDDIRYAQTADGSIPDVAPPYFKYYNDNMTWAGAYLDIADMLYKQYGMVQPIQEHYPFMKKWLYYMMDRYLDNHILTKDSYGDWCPPPKTIEEGRGVAANVKHPSELISTAYLYYYLRMMQGFAKLTGNHQDIGEYNSIAEKVKEAFNDSYFNADSGSYGTNTLTDNLLPLYFNMVPEDHRKDVLNNIADIIMIEYNGHLSTGLIGVKWLMRSLTENGMEDIAFKLVTNTSYPSWGYMIENGATTIWELWNGNTAAPSMNSQNHVMMLGDLIIWYYENLAGIKSSGEYPGFKQIIMNPAFSIGLDYVNASCHSVYGLIKSHWKKENGKIYWNVDIPANTSAIIHFPAGNKKNILENDIAISDINGLKYIGLEEDRIVCKIGSGSYKFEIIK